MPVYESQHKTLLMRKSVEHNTVFKSTNVKNTQKENA